MSSSSSASTATEERSVSPSPSTHADVAQEVAQGETSTIDTADLGSRPSEANEGEDEESGQSQAFNPETGEINWDCPCLGGMAQGTCGEQFKAAFSCFVFSEEEPKGMDCVEAFKAMQDCFRAHPEEYANEINEEDEEVDNEINEENKEVDNDTDVEDNEKPE
ncbi:Oxidoreductase [Coemansia thaxteri]|uniref:Mitochondrial intermembrane space import and assembly protein 40 n=1 Tax=Coemansia thaxteri TaxID=2663907 RepID=A0A9W8BAX6_9FUNG|nr:Oxidoreductase [Coemansia thaxteri]KAJ2000739.1 Oxidoreductase [Coemansia thaxteri]KAJ2467263.1 Oxidoreductase [Coemansia sp. RSA 2322]KAJ2478542.1 Oxidoreductase [Coemansia sp. RSA 2320]